MVHIILFSTIALGFLTRKSSKVAQLFPFLILFLFAALRYKFGNDYNGYYQNFYLIKLGKTIYHDVFFEYMNKIFPDFFSMIGVISLFYIGVVYWMVRKNVPSDYICGGLFVFVISPYLFLMNLSALRQCIAMLFFMVAIHFGTKKNYIVYVVLLLIASQFHSSALVLLPVIFVVNEKPFNKKYFIGFVSIVVLMLISDGFVQSIGKFLDNYEEGRFSAYIDDELTNSLRATILSGISMVYVLINLPDLKGKALVYSKLYLLSPTLAVLAVRLSQLTRIQMYFDIFAIVSLPLIFKHNLEKGEVIIKPNDEFGAILEIFKRYVFPMLIIIIYFLRYYSFFTNPMWKSFTTYQTIFSAI
jgi:hypothetical protein